MQIKGADDKQPDLDALDALLERPDVNADQRKRIEQEVRRIRAGAAGERDAAYEIEFHLADNTNRVTIHDLRLEVGGRVAQIDHLIINRLLDIWVLESKHFAEGVAINDFGEWTGFFGGRPYGMASPVEQNRKHIAVLEQVFAAGLVRLPKRLGIATIKPWIRPLVLVSTGARISRPRSKAAQAKVEGLDSVVKADQLVATINRDLDTRSTTAIAKIVSPETIARLGRELAAQHRPITVDWAARFGLPPTPVIEPPPVLPAVVAPPDDSGTGSNLDATCSLCGKPLSPAAIEYCRANAERFAGRVLCYVCQRRAGRTSRRATG